MKSTPSFLVMLGLFVFKASYGDVIPDNSHFVENCVKITNLSDYGAISLIGHVRSVMSDDYNYLISSAKCLEKGYKFNSLEIYAVSNEYIEGKEIEDLDLPNDEHAFKSTVQINPSGGYQHDSIPVSAIEKYYKIIGFTNNEVVLHEWKEIISFNNGSTDLIQIFEYEGDASGVFQNLPENGKIDNTRTDVYPNPDHSCFHLKMSNRYTGNVNIEMIKMSGEIVKKLSIEKNTIMDHYELSVYGLSRGSYIIKLMFGDMTETKKIIIN